MPNQEESSAAALDWRPYLEIIEHMAPDYVRPEITRCAILVLAKAKLSPGAFRKLCSKLEWRPPEVSIRVAIGKKSYLLSQCVENLPPAWTTWYPLTRLEDSVFLELVAAGRIHKKSTASEVRQIVDSYDPK